MKKQMVTAIMAVFYLFITLTLSGCEVPDNATDPSVEDGTEGDIVDQFDPKLTVCNPFGDDETANNRGIVGSLKYLPEAQARDVNGNLTYSGIDYFVQNATQLEHTIFFNKLFVPTRPWDRGFQTKAGQEIQVQRPDGSMDTLYEHFYLNMKTHLKLGAAETAGYYQLAILSDDGARVSVPDGNGGETVFLDNDGNHPTKFACATEPVYFDGVNSLPVTIEYYQGPRYHISMIMMWRPWPSDNNWRDSECGMSGNSRYFDSTVTPPKPTTRYWEMLARGWKVLDNENYQLLPEIENNPCSPEEDMLLLTGFAISNVLQTEATLTWQTSTNASSKVIVKRASDGATMEVVTSGLSTSHSVTVTGLTANTLYIVEGISTSPGGQEARSGEYAFRTRR